MNKPKYPALLAVAALAAGALVQTSCHHQHGPHHPGKVPTYQVNNTARPHHNNHQTHQRHRKPAPHAPQKKNYSGPRAPQYAPGQGSRVYHP